MSTSDPQPSSTPVRVITPGLTRREFREFKKRIAKLAKQARCHGVGAAAVKAPAGYVEQVEGAIDEAGAEVQEMLDRWREGDVAAGAKLREMGVRLYA